MHIHLLWIESTYDRHDISQRKANQWHQRSHGQNIRREDHPHYVFDGEARQAEHYDAEDYQDAETSLSRK